MSAGLAPALAVAQHTHAFLHAHTKQSLPMDCMVAFLFYPILPCPSLHLASAPPVSPPGLLSPGNPQAVMPRRSRGRGAASPDMTVQMTRKHVANDGEPPIQHCCNAPDTSALPCAQPASVCCMSMAAAAALHTRVPLIIPSAPPFP